MQQSGRLAKKWNAIWHHCPGVLNPADMASRGVTFEKLIQSDWFQGPTWIRRKDAWPKSDESAEEVESSEKANVLSIQFSESCWERFSSWKKIVRIIRVIL